MKKGYRFNELSDQTCEGKGCKRKLKKRRVDIYEDTLCYRCNIKRQLRKGSWNNHLNKLKKVGLI